MRWKLVWRRPFLTITQLIILLAVIIGLYVALDLGRRAQAGRMVGVGEDSLRRAIEYESTRQVELKATLTYVESEEYVAVYAREEGGFLLPGERKVVPLVVELTPAPEIPLEATPDPAIYARPWQAWWQLISDAPLPTR
ncbi:MAG: hypothetical protein BMS9Abin02_1272 [Anaerolineae bacterium]|nr:MAG: hypothetical protein BMS9Abin02_1272 [Anaerolineae bacterium]